MKTLDAMQQEDDGNVIASIAAKIEMHVGRFAEAAKRIEKRLSKPAMQPVITHAAGTAVANASGLAVITLNLDGPTQGHVWYIRAWRIGGLTPITVAAGRADLFVSGGYIPQALAANLTGIGMTGWRDFVTAMPAAKFYGVGEQPVITNEHVFVVLSGATNGQEYVANFSITDFELATEETTWSM